MKTAKIVLALMILVAFACAALAAVPAPRGPRPAGAPKGPVKGQPQPQWWGKPPGERPYVSGTVANVSATNIAVKTRDGIKPFVVNDKTRVRVRGQKATIQDVKVGDPVSVAFVLQENNVALALMVVVPKPSVAGVITAVEGDVVTIKGKDGALHRVLTSAETKFRSHGYAGTIADLRIGYKAGANGDIVGDELKAEAVSFVPVVARGTVTAVNGDVITVKTVKQLMLQCKASPATAVLIRPRVGPNQRGTLADIKVGIPCDIGFHAVKTGEVPLLWIDLLTGM